MRLRPALSLPLLIIAIVAMLGASSPAADQPGPTVVDSLDALRTWAARDHVRIKLKPGVYVLDRADSPRFLRFTGSDSSYDLSGVTLRIDTRLFQAFGNSGGPGFLYCAIDIAADRVVLEGLTTENFGDRPGVQSKNKIINITGSQVILRDVDITTSGSSPWGYGSLFGISGGPVRKMNGIRIGAPATGVQLQNCRVHMRAMGHGIFVQGARDTLIEGCTVDGLLRPTDSILTEKSGIAFDRGFKASGPDYVEGVGVGPQGQILPGEMIALSEDGIRLYDRSGDQPTGVTTIRCCTVLRMRRGICTGLGPAADQVTDCEVRECVTTGFNIGSRDTLRDCRADARFGEALCISSAGTRNADVDLAILDSRERCANNLVAVINGSGHKIRLHTSDPAFVPPTMEIALGTQRGYAYYQHGRGAARAISLINETPARIVAERLEP